MDSSLIVALIAAVVSLISLGVSVYVSVSQSRKTRFINTVTSERIKWMEKLRTQISAYCTQCWHYSVSSKNIGREDGIIIQKEIDKTGTLIRLLLNPNEAAGIKIIKRLENMRSLIFKNDIGDLLREIEGLTVDSQNLLKGAWEEVKDEARNGDLQFVPLYKRLLRKGKFGRAILQWWDNFSGGNNCA